MPRILILDNSCLNRLESSVVRDRLWAGLRATGRDFWPTAMNVLEALKSRNPARRTRLLRTLGTLAGENHALTLPGEALRLVAKAIAAGRRQTVWSDARITRFIRYPESVSDTEASSARQHLEAEEETFRVAHFDGSPVLRPLFRDARNAGHDLTLPSFLEHVWTTPTQTKDVLDRLWCEWGLGEAAPVDALLRDEAWRLFFDGWGAAIHARHIAHPQPRTVQHADLAQLVYLGGAGDRLLATEDRGFRDLANAILDRRYHLARVVSLDALLA